ncbi:MAG: UDP-N-acetylmuramate dehydrogenase [Acidobacteria bacterium]|nr:UDP-N-acetylmuramate dehydrogenase [Acidobacteriota bacterium]
MTASERLRAAGRLGENVALGPLTSFRLGGPARYLVTIDAEQDLRDAFEIATREGLSVLPLGRGSNVVVADAGFPGMVLQAGSGLSHRSIGEATVAGAAVPLPLLARDAARAGRGGLEFYTGIPGSVGGAIRMNAGCHGSETSDVLISVRVFDLETSTVGDRPAADLDLAYRHSNLGDFDFVLEARFATVKRPVAEAERVIRDIARWRRQHQPGGTFNAGSVFKNPEGEAAGRIIDRLGLKGLESGAVRVSRRHANFFEAGEGATARDVRSLVLEVQRRVRDETGIDLEPEIRFVGDFS